MWTPSYRIFACTAPQQRPPHMRRNMCSNMPHSKSLIIPTLRVVCVIQITMPSSVEALPPIDDVAKAAGPRYEVRSSRKVVQRPNTVPYDGQLGEDSSGPDRRSLASTQSSAARASGPPASTPIIARRGLIAKEWVGNRSLALLTIAGRAESLQQRVEV